MCGIHGIISNSLNKSEIQTILRDMGALQRHRGPDDQKEAVYQCNKKYIGFGFVRLSILDLKTGMQPIKCPVDQSAIICNGQIYNYLELKTLISSESFASKGDIEVALHLYRKKGLDFLQLLNGMYAGAIFDQQQNKVLIFRDRFGIKPLYYAEHKNSFIFASEIKPVLKVIGGSPELNQKGLESFFCYRYLPGTETMFKGVQRLPPGSYLDYDLAKGTYKVIRYWNYRLDREIKTFALKDAEEEFIDLFTDAVNIRLRADVEVGSFISAGIDSSAVAVQAVKKKPELKLFTVSFSQPEYDELPLVTDFIKNRNNCFRHIEHYTHKCNKESLALLPRIIKSLEEPVSLGTILPTYQVCRLASEHVKVVLTGEGADEIFCGYRKFLLEMAAAAYPSLSNIKRRLMHEHYPELADYLKIRNPDPVRRYIQTELLFSANEIKKLLGNTTGIDGILPSDGLPLLSGHEHPLNAMVAMESRFRLPDYVIQRLDKLSMSHSLEARTPFLDYRLAEFAARLPVEFKVDLDSNHDKFICRNAFYKKGILDYKSAFRVKQPFTIPLANWLSKPKDLPECFQEVLLGNMIAQQGILNPDFVKNLTPQVSAKGVIPATLVSDADRIFAICIFTLWYNIFMKDTVNFNEFK